MKLIIVACLFALCAVALSSPIASDPKPLPKPPTLPRPGVQPRIGLAGAGKFAPRDPPPPQAPTLPAGVQPHVGLAGAGKCLPVYWSVALWLWPDRNLRRFHKHQPSQHCRANQANRPCHLFLVVQDDKLSRIHHHHPSLRSCLNHPSRPCQSFLAQALPLKQLVPLPLPLRSREK
uniref:Uncharacterized protein n=1 Tax=Plectus sambesii TaxID=2011161 RepID=A0A914VHD3_9BILA